MATRYQGPELERRALDVFIKLNRSLLSIHRQLHGPLREFGLNSVQFGVLDAIQFGGPMPINTIADKCLCSQNSMCSVIDTLERNGLVVRQRSTRDRRVVHVDMTDRGRQVFSLAWPANLRAIVRSVEHLSSEEQSQLNTLLRKLGHGAERPS